MMREILGLAQGGRDIVFEMIRLILYLHLLPMKNRYQLCLALYAQLFKP